MNINKYAKHYDAFHKCPVSFIHEDIMIIGLAEHPVKNWLMLRTYPFKSVYADVRQPLVEALKTQFKSDVVASVFMKCDSWTLLLGNERVIIPADQRHATIFRYATPYYVKDPGIVLQYLKGAVRPTYENVYTFQNTIFYLDNHDIPYPGGCYFNSDEGSSYYRLCFLTNEPVEKVLSLATEWKNRRGVYYTPYMTKETIVSPKFLDFSPFSETNFFNNGLVSTGIVQKKLIDRHPHLLIQDILNSYYENAERVKVWRSKQLGLILEYPFQITYDGTRTVLPTDRKFVGLSVNGNKPEHIIHVNRPYDRFNEYEHVPAIAWTSISFVKPFLAIDPDQYKKVVIESIIVGLVYNGVFFCLSRPLLEGVPFPQSLLNTDALLSTATELRNDHQVTIIEKFRHNEKYSLNRVSLKDVPFETWCLSPAKETHVHPRNIRLPPLVQKWTDFVSFVGESMPAMDVSVVKLAQAFAKHKICFSLKTSDADNNLRIQDGKLELVTAQEKIEFINQGRLTVIEAKEERSSLCVIS